MTNFYSRDSRPRIWTQPSVQLREDTSPRRLQRASSSPARSPVRGRIARAGTGGILGSSEMSPQLGRADSDPMPATEFSPTGRLATTDFGLPTVVEQVET